MPSPTPDDLDRWLIPSQEWVFFELETLEQLRDAKPVNNPVDNETDAA